MRFAKPLRALVAVALFTAGACTPSVSVQYNYDPDYDFKPIETFHWLGIHNDGSVPPFDLTRLGNAIVAELEDKHLRATDDAEVQVLVAGYLGITPAQTKKWEYSHGLYWTEKMTSILEGTLVVDIVDARTRNLIWRAVGNGMYRQDASPEERERGAARVAKKLLASFPPSN